MDYVTYGNAGIKVSRISWDVMNFYDHTDEAGAIRMVHEAIDAGINFFDTVAAVPRLGDFADPGRQPPGTFLRLTARNEL